MLKDKAISLRVPAELFEQIEELALVMADDPEQMGRVTKSAVAVHAMRIGVQKLQNIYPIKKKGKTSKRRRKTAP
jgi:hypothetical protein